MILLLRWFSGTSMYVVSVDKYCSRNYNIQHKWLLLFVLEFLITMFWLLLLLIILLKRVMQGRERAIYTLSLRRPSPQFQPIKKNREKENSIEDKNGGTQPMPMKKHWPCSERYWKCNKRPAVLWGLAVKRDISIPMSDQSTTCNPHSHIRHW